MSLKLPVLTLILLLSAVDGEFNKDVNVYDGVIRGVQNYFKNGNIVIFHAMDNLGKSIIHKHT